MNFHEFTWILMNFNEFCITIQCLKCKIRVTDCVEVVLIWSLRSWTNYTNICTRIIVKLRGAKTVSIDRGEKGAIEELVFLLINLWRRNLKDQYTSFTSLSETINIRLISTFLKCRWSLFIKYRYFIGWMVYWTYLIVRILLH